MKFKVTFQELAAFPPLTGFDHTVDQGSELLCVRSGDPRSSPLQGKGLQFNPQHVELADFVDIKGGDERPFVLDATYESFMLKTDQSLAYRRRSHVHLPGDLTLDDHRSRLQHTREESVLQGSDYAFRQ